MPALSGSRYLNAPLIRGRTSGQPTLASPSPLRFRVHPRNRVHVVVEGDTVFHLAEKYYGDLSGRGRGVARAAGLWWAIADFQPTPIVDPTLELEVGREIIIPAFELITDHLRRREP